MRQATTWNSAKFKEFIEGKIQITSNNLDEWWQNNWWQPAYEAAYLATIRLEQGNTVEAFFHSFRAVEGLISKWAEEKFSDHIISNDDSPKLKITIFDVFPDYLGKKDQKETLEDFKDKGILTLSGFPLYALLRADRTTWRQDCRELSKFTDEIARRRNKLFHRLRGLQRSEVFEAWNVDESEAWKARILRYLNFVSEKQFESLEQASLMVEVHKELEEAIAAYELQP